LFLPSGTVAEKPYTVGVVPLFLAGYDVRALLHGASTFVDGFFEGKEEHLLEKAAFYAIHSKKRPINVLFSYANELENLTKWYVQLWGESLGKISYEGEHVGLTPIGLIGAVDQHSFLQLLIEGPPNKTVTFINISDFERHQDPFLRSLCGGFGKYFWKPNFAATI